MKGQTVLLRVLLVCMTIMLAFPAWAEPFGEFSPMVGIWKQDSIDGANVMIVDGSQHAVSSNEHFSIATYLPQKNFQEGSITVQFKPIAGKSDQAGGIFFDRKDNGEYLVLRANALESNLNLYRYASGRRSPIKETDGAPAQAGVWHELKLVISKSHVQGYLDGKLLLQYDLGKNISGGVGLWSKDDSVTMFKDFHVASKKP